MTWEPDVVDENVYWAEPPERAREDEAVVPSTVMLRVPVGVAVTVVELDVIWMVMTSFAPEAGVDVAADSVVVVDARLEEVEPGHAASRLYRSMEPRPVAWSYPVVVPYAD